MKKYFCNFWTLPYLWYEVLSFLTLLPINYACVADILCEYQTHSRVTKQRILCYKQLVKLLGLCLWENMFEKIPMVYHLLQPVPSWWQCVVCKKSHANCICFKILYFLVHNFQLSINGLAFSSQSHVDILKISKYITKEFIWLPL